MVARFFALTIALLLGFSLALRAQEAVERTTTTAPDKEPSLMETRPTEEASPPQEPVRKSTASAETSSRPAAKPKTIEGMTAEEFNASGLDKLSPEELKNLDAALKGQKRAAEAKAAEQATVKAEKKAEKKAQETATRNKVKVDRIESHVDGRITRVEGNSVIRLEDGSKWKQADRDARFQAQVVDRPEAVVFRTFGGWKMRIAGMPEFYVNQVKE